jgi:hypothetical protein
MSTLLDEKHRPVPICNMQDDKTDSNFYVSDMDDYNQVSKKYKNYTFMFLAASIVLCLFLCIFTLNFGVSGWSVGNFVTFLVIIGLFYGAYAVGKEWMENQNLLNRIQNDGVPCYTTVENSNENIVHCSKNKNTIDIGI